MSTHGSRTKETAGKKFNNTDKPQNEEEKMFDTGPQNEEGDNENKKSQLQRQATSLKQRKK